MQVKDLSLSGVKLITPDVFEDQRGFFLETHSVLRYVVHGMDTLFVQDNFSISKKGTIRALHFQSQPGQTKLVSCLGGAIWDVAVDLRPSSSTYKQWLAVELTEKNHLQLFIPIGFAHGFCVLSDQAAVHYKVSSPYDGKTECTIRWDDPELRIPWPTNQPILSARDQSAPFLKEMFHAMDYRC